MSTSIWLITTIRARKMPWVRAFGCYLAFAMLVLAGCGDDDPTVPSSHHQGITRTDTLGQILTLDIGDWCLERVVISTHLFVDVDRIYFICSDPGDTATTSLRVLNHSARNVRVTVISQLNGLQIAPTTVSLSGGDDVHLTATYVQEGEEVHEGRIVIQADLERVPVTIPAQGQLSSGPIVFLLPIDSFGPAFPNPCQELVKIPFSLAASQQVIITIHPADGSPYYPILASQLPAGHHLAEWNSRDTQGQLVPKGIYTAHIVAGDLDCWGDIEVAR